MKRSLLTILTPTTETHNKYLYTVMASSTSVELTTASANADLVKDGFIWIFSKLVIYT